MNFTFCYPLIVWLGIPLCIVLTCFRWLWYKPVTIVFPRVYEVARTTENKFSVPRCVSVMLRALTLICLLVALARPRVPDTRSVKTVDGIDCMIVLDVSGSMNLFDDLNDRKTRISIAKKEALSFIHKRPYDAFGLVLFGSSAVSRCPLTTDKKLLSEIIKSIEIGVVDERETVLCQAMALAAYRLSTSCAKTKIMIVLTDGVPSPHDVQPEAVLQRIKELGIKVYTIGIGSEKGGYQYHDLYGLIQAETYLNKHLLIKCAQETGGQFFQARSAEDMARIYDTINTLETTSHEQPSYTRYHEYFMGALIAAIVFFLLELLCTTYVWRGFA